MRAGRMLPRSFYARDSRELAPTLLGKVLEHDDPGAGLLRVRIVEVEAYAGAEDPASHAYRGKSPRNATMFGPPGQLYVYFTYGMHWCACVVAGEQGRASAVLLRAGIPLTGLEPMRARRVVARTDVDLCSGPAKLTQALGLSGTHDGADLIERPRRPGRIRILDDGVATPVRPGVSTRVGLNEGLGDDEPWRWFVTGDPNVSRGPRLPVGTRSAKSPRGPG